MQYVTDSSIRLLSESKYQSSRYNDEGYTTLIDGTSAAIMRGRSYRWSIQGGDSTIKRLGDILESGEISIRCLHRVDGTK